MFTRNFSDKLFMMLLWVYLKLSQSSQGIIAVFQPGVQVCLLEFQIYDLLIKPFHFDWKVVNLFWRFWYFFLSRFNIARDVAESCVVFCYFVIDITFFAKKLFAFQFYNVEMPQRMLQILWWFVKRLFCLNFTLLGFIFFLAQLLQGAFSFTNFDFQGLLGIPLRFQPAFDIFYFSIQLL